MMMRRPGSIKLFNLFGIRIGVDRSWFFILFLMIFWLSISFRNTLQSSDAVAYAHMGISSMNGKTDESDETVSKTDFQTILAYAQQHHIARLTFWSVNRDRACGPGLDADSCSGVSQSQYDYTKIFVQYTG